MSWGGDSRQPQLQARLQCVALEIQSVRCETHLNHSYEMKRRGMVVGVRSPVVKLADISLSRGAMVEP